MTAEELQFLIDSEIKMCMDDGAKWIKSSVEWELWISELHIAELENYIKQRVNKYLDIADTLHGAIIKRHLGDKLYNTKIRLPYNQETESGLESPEDVDIDRAVIILNYFGGPGVLYIRISELLGIQEFINYEVDVFKKGIEDEIQKHLVEIGKLQQELEEAAERMKEKGYIM